MPSEKSRYLNRPRRPHFDLPDLTDEQAPFMICPHVNRSVLILHYREPYLAWIDRVDPDHGRLLRARPDRHRHAVLFPGGDTMAEAEPWLREWCHLLFAEKLTRVTHRIADWPTDRSWDAFRAWFDLDVVGSAIDFGSDPIRAEVWE